MESENAYTWTTTGGPGGSGGAIVEFDTRSSVGSEAVEPDLSTSIFGSAKTVLVMRTEKAIAITLTCFMTVPVGEMARNNR